MTFSMPPPEPGRPADDYIIERDGERAGPSVTAHIVTALRMLMVVVLAAASLALFWVVGTMIGLF